MTPHLRGLAENLRTLGYGTPEVRELLVAVVGPQCQILPWDPASSLPSASLPALFKTRDAHCQGSLFHRHNLGQAPNQTRGELESEP